jgi:hypothetical protein
VDEIKERGGADPEEVAVEMAKALDQRFGSADMVMPLSATTFVGQMD